MPISQEFNGQIGDFRPETAPCADCGEGFARLYGVRSTETDRKGAVVSTGDRLVCAPDFEKATGSPRFRPAPASATSTASAKPAAKPKARAGRKR